MPRSKNLKYLLLQIRDQDDPVLQQERVRFKDVLECEPDALQNHDLLDSIPSSSVIDACDMVLIAGSGDYSVTDQNEWLRGVLDLLRDLHGKSKPTFGSCWGGQALALAMGGTVATDMELAELGALPMRLTPDGKQDAIFRSLPESFLAVCGHQDSILTLPDDAVLLASSKRVTNQAFRFEGKPIYGTQFHPELNRKALIQRLETYPVYVEKIAGMSMGQFVESCLETPEVNQVLPNFVDFYLG